MKVIPVEVLNPKDEPLADKSYPCCFRGPNALINWLAWAGPAYVVCFSSPKESI